MVSDDTEHTVLVGQCLALNPPDAQSFQRMLAWKLRWWLLCAPAGIGFATLRSVLKLWVGFPASRSGVFSAGNGPAMRSAIIGTYFAEDTFRIREYVRASTRLTHTDPRAETAGLAVAFTAARAIQFKEAARQNLTDLHDLWISADSRDAAWVELVGRIIEAHQRDASVLDFARELGLDVELLDMPTTRCPSRFMGGCGISGIIGKALNRFSIAEATRTPWAPSLGLSWRSTVPFPPNGPNGSATTLVLNPILNDSLTLFAWTSLKKKSSRYFFGWRCRFGIWFSS